MKPKLILTSIFIAVILSAQDNPLRTKEYSFIEGMGKYVQTILPLLPGDLSKAVNTYIEVMQPTTYKDDSVHVANRGLEKTNLATMAGKCEKDLLRQLYNSDEIKNPGKKFISIISEKPPELQSGWLWEKALKISGGNPNLAIKLIGFCGHDDESLVTDEIADNFKLSCPVMQSNFYSHKALGEKVDIDQALKKYVSDSQSIHAAPERIKAKNYHIFAAAQLGCKMIENGVPKEKVAGYAQMFGYLYRRIALCRSSKETTKSFAVIKKIYDSELRLYNLDRSGKVESPSMIAILEKILIGATKLNYNEMSNMHSYQRKYLNLPNEDSKKKLLDRFATEFYSAQYYLKETNCPDGTSGEVAEGLKMVTLPSNVMNSNFVYGPNPEQFNDKCSAGDYCAKVYKHLQTWDADFKWTMAQHKVGAQFGSEKCSSDKKIYTKEPSTCIEAISAPASVLQVK